jgi:hypothetical protein
MMRNGLAQHSQRGTYWCAPHKWRICLNVTSLSVTNLSVTNLSVTNLNVTSLDVTNLDMTSLEVTSLDMTSLKVTSLDVTGVARMFAAVCAMIDVVVSVRTDLVIPTLCLPQSVAFLYGVAKPHNGVAKSHTKQGRYLTKTTLLRFGRYACE